jgi:hypothetical protein
MPTTREPQITRSSIYIDAAEAEVLRELASELGLVQHVGGGAKYQAGSLSGLMRFLAAAAMTPHRPQIVQFLTALQSLTATK